MASNRLAGSGPTAPTPGASDGPSPGLSGTLGVAPQAPPQTTSNMLSGPSQNSVQRMPTAAGSPPPAPLVPPSREKLLEAFSKTAYLNQELKSLLSKSDLSAKDIITATGQAVADSVMSSFQAASYLKDLPATDNSLELRQWVAGHFGNSSKTLQTVAEMLAAHGAMTRRVGAAPPQGVPQQPQAAPPQNMFSRPAPPPQTSMVG